MSGRVTLSHLSFRVENGFEGEHALKAFCYMRGDARKGVDHMVGATRARADTEYQDEAKGAD